MSNRRNVVVYIAASLDGYIARENGDIDWLDMVKAPKEDYGYIISIIPILLSGGIPLFRSPHASSALRLVCSTAYPTVLVQLCYEPKS